MDSDLYDSVKERFHKARALAVTLGELVGRVSRNVPGEADEDRNEVAVVVSPDVYYKYPFMGKRGLILAAVDIKSLLLVLLRAKGYLRRDAVSLLYSNKEMSHLVESEEDEPGGLLTNVVVRCEPLTQLDVLDSREPEAANVTLEPQSPVIIPNPEVVERSLSLSRGEIRLGFLENSATEVKVSISPDDLNYHCLIVGTTGAGKTSLVKNMLSQFSRDQESKTFVIDATGDYYHVILPPLIRQEDFERLGISVSGLNLDLIYPLSRRWIKKYMEGKESMDVEEITRKYYELYLRPIVEWLSEKGKKINVALSGNKIAFGSEKWTSVMTFRPFWFSFRESKRILPRLNPYFTEQASHFLRVFLRDRELSASPTLSSFYKELLNRQQEIYNRYSIHKSTWENVVRGLNLLMETGLFDVSAPREDLGETLKSKGRIAVLDLYNSELEDFSQKIFTYYVLERLFSAREAEMKTGSLKSRYLVVIDEAHRFFPSRINGEDEVYVRKVSGKIATMMRLGRRRKMGFLFVTHDLSDLSEIVQQLANTRVLFRMRSEVAEKMGLPKGESRELAWERNGVCYVMSPWFREGYVKIRVPLPPPVGHYDLSRSR
jgi:DNA helicase HerA-like ATPase